MRGNHIGFVENLMEARGFRHSQDCRRERQPKTHNPNIIRDSPTRYMKSYLTKSTMYPQPHCEKSIQWTIPPSIISRKVFRVGWLRSLDRWSHWVLVYSFPVSCTNQIVIEKYVVGCNLYTFCDFSWSRSSLYFLVTIVSEYDRWVKAYWTGCSFFG